jgi:hypothetical protein
MVVRIYKAMVMERVLGEGHRPITQAELAELAKETAANIKK